VETRDAQARRAPRAHGHKPRDGHPKLHESSGLVVCLMPEGGGALCDASRPSLRPLPAVPNKHRAPVVGGSPAQAVGRGHVTALSRGTALEERVGLPRADRARSAFSTSVPPARAQPIPRAGCHTFAFRLEMALVDRMTVVAVFVGLGGLTSTGKAVDSKSHQGSMG
jgi:hypothetical protein